MATRTRLEYYVIRIMPVMYYNVYMPKSSCIRRSIYFPSSLRAFSTSIDNRLKFSSGNWSKVANLDGCHCIFHYMATNAETFNTASKSTYPNHRTPGLTVLEKLGMDSVGDVSRRSCSRRLPPYQIIIPKCPYYLCKIHRTGQCNAKSLHLNRQLPRWNPCRIFSYSLFRCHSGFPHFLHPHSKILCSNWPK